MASTTGVLMNGAPIPRSGVLSSVVSQATHVISFRGAFKAAATSAGIICKAPTIPSKSPMSPPRARLSIGAETDLLISADYFEVTCPAALVSKSGCTPACCIPGGPSAVPTFSIPPPGSPAQAAPNGPPPEPQGVFITSAGYYSFQPAPVRRSATPVASLAAVNSAPLR